MTKAEKIVQVFGWWRDGFIGLRAFVALSIQVLRGAK